MGRHTAPDGDGVHPVVAAALARRGVDSNGAHRDDAMERFATQRIDGNVGWPGEPPAREGGLGWPGELGQHGPDLAGDADEELDEDLPEHSGEPVARRRGWRRLLGSGRAA